jgi:hypothetical protein
MPPPGRRYDERDDFDDQPQRPQTNPGLIVALVVGGAFALGCVACAGIGLFGFWAAPVPVAQGPVAVPGAPVEAEAGGANARQPAGEAAGRKRAAEEAEDDRAQADYLARHEALARERDAGIEDRYRRLTPAQQQPVDDLRATVACASRRSRTWWRGDLSPPNG